MEITLCTPKNTHNTSFFNPSQSQSQSYHHQHQTNDLKTMQTTSNTSTSHQYNSHNTSTSRSSDSVEPSGGDEKWASKLLSECARAITDKDSNRIHHLLWMLNELASPYGDCDQKLASYFLQALFCKATESGQRCFKTLTQVAEKSNSFDSARKLILKFQEVSPWTTFGHVAANGAILEALDNESKLHIIDISNTLCTQWPTLLESLATRHDDTPRLKLTVVVTTANIVGSVMKEIGQRMEKFARLMGVPFEFNVISGLNRLGDLSKDALGVQDDEAIAINCVGALRRVDVEERRAVIQMFQSLNPRVVTVVEEEADFTSLRHDFVKCFEECLRYYTLYFEMLEDSFAPTSNERLMLERECSRSIVRILACDGNELEHERDCDDGTTASSDQWGECERRERGSQWSERLSEGFSPIVFSDDVVDDVKALLKRYRSGWSLVNSQAHQGEHESSSLPSTSTGIYLTWKDEPVVWASAWKP